MRHSLNSVFAGLFAVALIWSPAQASHHHQCCSKPALMSAEMLKSLNLTESQQKAWEALKQKADVQFEKMGAKLKADHAKVESLMSEEAAKSNPDLNKIVAAKRKMWNDVHDIRRAMNSDAEKFMATLNPEQKRIVLKDMQERSQKFDAMWKQSND